MDDNYNNNQPYGQPYQPYQPQQNDYNQQYQQPQTDYSQQYQQPQTDYSQQYQPYGTQGSYQPYGTDNGVTPDGPTGPAKTMGLISMICGIVSVVCACFGGGVLFGIAAVVLSVLAKKKYTGTNKQAQIGMILGIVGAAISLIATIIIFAVACANGMSSSYSYYY